MEESGHLRVKFSRMVRCQRGHVPSSRSLIHLQSCKTFTNHFRENSFFFFFWFRRNFYSQNRFFTVKSCSYFSSIDTGTEIMICQMIWLVEKYSSNRFQKNLHFSFASSWVTSLSLKCPTFRDVTTREVKVFFHFLLDCPC